MYEKIIAGVVTGIGYSIVGWQKEIDTKDREFKWGKLGRNVAICSIVGGIAGYNNIEIGVLMTGTVGIGVTKIVSLIIKFVKNRFMKKA